MMMMMMICEPTAVYDVPCSYTDRCIVRRTLRAVKGLPTCETKTRMQLPNTA